MATTAQPTAGPKRPRLSLQTKTAAVTAASKPNRTYSVNPSDPTAFNTLSNVYTTAIERSTPTTSSPATSLNTLYGSRLTLNTNLKSTLPYGVQCLDSPLSASACSPVRAFPSVMTPTPPMSAGPVDGQGARVFVFSQTTETTIRQLAGANPCSPLVGTPLRRFGPTLCAPYAHPRSLRSILRNSPLPPRSNISPISPRRQSQRLLERAARRVAYHSPLEQEITTNKYTRSHIDLLLEELSPSPASQTASPVGIARAFTRHEIEDGGQTPGPMEDASRRFRKLTTGSPVSSGVRKRKWPPKKRRWVWTIGHEADEGDDEEVGGAIAALRAQAAAAAAGTASLVGPDASTTCERSPDSAESADVDMSDSDSITCSEATVTSSIDAAETDLFQAGNGSFDMKTPTGPVRVVTDDETEDPRDTPTPGRLEIS